MNPNDFKKRNYTWMYQLAKIDRINKGYTAPADKTKLTMKVLSKIRCVIDDVVILVPRFDSDGNLIIQQG